MPEPRVIIWWRLYWKQNCFFCSSSCIWFFLVYVCMYVYINLLCACVHVHIQSAYDKFPDFFVQAFKIIVDSWKFSILLLYILWDDWPIFMISGSNEQLRQQLEYTLLNPDYHSWWISKMQSDTLEERYTIKFCFKLGKNATETYGMLQTAFLPTCMNRTSVFEWHKRFKEGRESVTDDERCARSKEVGTPELIGQIKNFMDKDCRVSCGNCTHN